METFAAAFPPVAVTISTSISIAVSVSTVPASSVVTTTAKFLAELVLATILGDIRRLIL